MDFLHYAYSKSKKWDPVLREGAIFEQNAFSKSWLGLKMAHKKLMGFLEFQFCQVKNLATEHVDPDRKKILYL